MGVSIVVESIDWSILQWFHECILYLFFGTNHYVLKYYIKIVLYQYPNWLHYLMDRSVCCCWTVIVCFYYSQTERIESNGMESNRINSSRIKPNQTKPTRVCTVVRKIVCLLNTVGYPSKHIHVHGCQHNMTQHDTTRLSRHPIIVTVFVFLILLSFFL